MDLGGEEDSGVVIDDVQRAEAFDGFRDHRFGLARFGDVRLEGESLPGRFGNLRDGSRGAVFVHIHDRNLGAFLCEQNCSGPPDTRTRARNQRNFAVQFSHKCLF